VYDRVCRVAMSYQPADEETSIVVRELGAVQVPEAFLAGTVEVTRLTRSHPDLRVGSSVRGAVDFAKVAVSLADLRGSAPDDPPVSLDAALVALSGRVRVREGSSRTAEEIVTELWNSVFGPRGDGGADGGKGGAPTRGTTSR
ncbi:MAG: hypothetical protein RJB57_930, partial [Actinomycetota bacterium]